MLQKIKRKKQARMQMLGETENETRRKNQSVSELVFIIRLPDSTRGMGG